MAYTTFAVTSEPQQITGLTNGQTYRAQNQGNTAATNDAFRFKSVPFIYIGSFASGITPTRDDEPFLYYPLEEATLKPISTEEIWAWCRSQGSTSVLKIEQTS